MVWAAAANAAIPASERAALIAIFNATSGGSWTHHENWLGPAGTECGWYGVACSSGNANVTELDLYQNGLRGALPPEVGNFPQLQRLSLFSNQLSGAVPPEIGNLTQLTYLALGDNQLKGPIPSQLGNLVNVGFFSFNGDLLDGPIPPELGHLTKADVIDLSYNTIKGPIPRELGNATALQQLYLNDNQLTGTIPPELGNLTHLTDFSVKINQLIGPIPVELSHLAALENLDLGINQLSGAIPPQLGNLTALQTLYLSQNQLSGSIPAALSKLTSLTEIVLSGNQLSGTIPPELGQLANLQRLNLEQNDLTGTIPSELGRLTNLKVLSVGNNQLTGTLPRELTSLTHLVGLAFNSNQITGTLPFDLAQLTSLQELIAYDNRLTGTIPGGIGSLTALQHLLLGGNQLSGTIPPSITNLAALTFLDLRGNDFTGGLPQDIDRMSSLENISVFGNRLSGPIPPAVAKLPSLSTLRLEDNEFTGTIPSNIVDLTKLTFLGLGGNHLEGTIPAGIGRLTALSTLWLDANRLTGTIPAEIGALTNLGWINLGNNQFTGSPPRALINLVNLTDNLSSFSFNLLSTNDADLIAFMNRKQDGGQWLNTQTLPPSTVAAASITDRSAVISWNLATYTDDEGGYQVTVAAANGSAIATTNSKLLSSILVRGLAASTAYTVTVRTVTHPHGRQQNTLTSDPAQAAFFTTAAAVVAPASVELTTSPNGLLEQNGLTATDQFTLSNFGDVPTALTVTVSGDFFTIVPAAFTLPGGGSQIVTVTSLPKPAGAYSGAVLVSGAGVPSGFSVPIEMLSVAPPAGFAFAQPAAPRVDVSGAVSGSARFMNSGTATLTAIAVSDSPWIVPPTTAITIAPGASADVPFTIDLAKRPSTSGALAGGLRLVYAAGTAAPIVSGGSGVSVSTVTVVFTQKPDVTTGAIPPLAPGEVARFIAGVQNASRLVSDLFISNAFGVSSIRDLRLYLGSSVAAFPQLDPSQSLQLASVVSSVYSSGAAVSTLQLRTADWDKLLVNASIVDFRAALARNSAIPVFRSDRAVGPGGQMILAGVEKSDTRQTDIFVQETAGGSATATIQLLDLSGKATDTKSVSLSPYGLTQLPDVASSSGTAIVTPMTGQIVAYAMVSDLRSGDRWTVADWAHYFGFASADPVKIPFAEGTPAKGRHRAVPHAAVNASKSDLTIFDADGNGGTVTVTFYPAGISRDITLGASETRTLRDVVALLGGSGAGSIVVTPVHGDIAVTSRTYFDSDNGSLGSAVAARSDTSGLRLGQKQTFAGIESTAASTPGFGCAESQGASATIRATLVYQNGRSVYATTASHDYQIGPRGTLLVSDLTLSILGPARASLGDLHNLQITFQLIGGSGAITPFVTSMDNSTGQASVRVE